MRDIDVYSKYALTNANNIKSAFDTYVTGYFSSITVTGESNHAYVNFYITGRESTAFQIQIADGFSLPLLLIGNDTWTITHNMSSVYRVIVTDNAIAVDFAGYSSAWANYVTIYKTESNDIMLYIAKTGSGNTIKDFTAANESSYTVVMYKLLDSSISWYTNTALINTDGYVLGAPLVHRTSGASKNVFIPLNRCYAGIHEAFKFQIGSDSYAGIGFNSLIVKSE